MMVTSKKKEERYIADGGEEVERVPWLGDTFG
jgi:hypothetical protein